MEINTLTDGASFEQLKCSVCHSYLSCFPIRLSANNQNICGRCKAPEDSDLVRNVAFETVSQYLLFPCVFNCGDSFCPNEVPSHEKKCLLRLVSCPISACEWRGCRADALRHCEDSHSIVRNGEIVVDVACCDENKFLFVHEKKLLVFVQKYNAVSKMVQFEMFTSEFELNPVRYSCHLSAKCKNKTLEMAFNTTTFDEVSVNELNLESVINGQSVTLNVTIGDEVTSFKQDINFEMLAVLKCFSCLQYAIPPIYHCTTNTETLCAECQPSHKKTCDSCANNATRNINLDKMALILNYPCKNYVNGCHFVSKPDKLKSHRCDLGDFECPFNGCDWRGPTKDIEGHVLHSHQELVKNFSQISKQLVVDRVKCDVIKFSGRLFRLACMKSKDRYLWSVQLVGPFKEGFKYEIEISGAKQRGRRLAVRQQCGQLNKTDCFQEGFYFLKEQMQDFVQDEVVVFTVRIFA